LTVSGGACPCRAAASCIQCVMRANLTREEATAALVSMGAARLELEGELAAAERFALAEGVRFAMGKATVGWRNSVADRMLHAAIMRVVLTVEEEISAAMESIAVANRVQHEPPCEVRRLVLDAVGSDEEGDTLGTATVDKAEWLHALLGLAEDVAGLDWEMEEQFRSLGPAERAEAEDALGLPERYFEEVEPRPPQLSGANRFLAGLRGPVGEGA